MPVIAKRETLTQTGSTTTLAIRDSPMPTRDTTPAVKERPDINRIRRCLINIVLSLFMRVWLSSSVVTVSSSIQINFYDISI